VVRCYDVAVDVFRDFFAHEGGRNTVEFFKETQSGDGLFIALKFESRSVAKDIINRLHTYITVILLVSVLNFLSCCVGALPNLQRVC